VARDVEEVEGDVVSPGGYVLESEPGLFENVLVLDFKSLYPSIIRTFRVDPWVSSRRERTPSKASTAPVSRAIEASCRDSSRIYGGRAIARKRRARRRRRAPSRSS
jgi:DNA polymerase elongation subunit (family B)